MAGLQRNAPTPIEIKLHQVSRLLEITFSDGCAYLMPYEFLRVHSPSAEVRGHGPGQEILQSGKRQVTIDRIDPVGNYGIRPIFSDGHDSGIYSWDVLYDLGARQEALWQDYLARIEAAGLSRDRDAEDQAKKRHGQQHAGCGKH